jgi:hypothetical protein
MIKKHSKNKSVSSTKYNKSLKKGKSNRNDTISLFLFLLPIFVIYT